MALLPSNKKPFERRSVRQVLHLQRQGFWLTSVGAHFSIATPVELPAQVRRMGTSLEPGNYGQVTDLKR
jgi:hypothetical protein